MTKYSISERFAAARAVDEDESIIDTAKRFQMSKEVKGSGKVCPEKAIAMIIARSKASLDCSKPSLSTINSSLQLKISRLS